MTGHDTGSSRLAQAGMRIYEKKWSFFGVFLLFFFGSVSVLSRLDLLPNPPKSVTIQSATPTVALATSVVRAASFVPVADTTETPVRITAAKIGLDATVANPSSTQIETLDQYLLKGAVRYPTSALLGATGNVVLFGHSSYLPIVGNQAYKTFDGIQKLVAGDEITVYSADLVYTYRVRSMAKESATSDAGIELSVTGKVLTLVTCNSFATKSDRFIVTADFVESHSISS